MGIGVLGPLTLDGDTPALMPRDRVVLSALTARAGVVVTRGQLEEALWGDGAPASAAKVVQGCVMRLRRTLGPAAIETVPTGYRLAVNGDEIDARRFERLVERASSLQQLGEHDRAWHACNDALALWRGPAFSDADDWEPARVEAIRMDELRLGAEELRVHAASAAGRFGDVIADAHAMVDAAPLRERRWELLARALYQAGRQGEALRVLREAREVLAGELGVDPGPDLIQLEQAILHHDESLLVDVTAPLNEVACPYPGLLSFEPKDSDHYFGRAGDVAACLRTLADEGVLAVVGPSGIGKSSLVRAGVAAALRRDGQRVRIVTPDGVSLDELLVLGADDAQILVVDQCETAFRTGVDGGARSRFFDAIEQAAAHGGLILALRADRLGELGTRPEIARRIERGLYLLGPMDEAHLREAIAGPARQAGLVLEPGLVDVLVTEVGLERGALPLLAHALRRTWELREGRTLTVDGYRRSGGIQAAVAQTAERLYLGLPEDRRDSLRTLMLRLVEVSDQGAPVGRRMARRTLEPADQALVEQLVDARLVTSDEQVVGLAHESVARAWPRLSTWLDEDVEGQRTLLHLAVAAESWEQMERPTSELYRGTRLDRTLAWTHATRPGLTTTERAFLVAAEALADGERTDAERRAAEQARSNRRLRRLLTVTGILLAVASVTGLLAWRQADRADQAAVAADARSVGARGLTVSGLDHALLLAVEGLRLEDSPETRANLLATLSGAPQLAGSAVGTGPLVAMDASPDGRLIAMGGSEVQVLSAEDLSVVATIDMPPGALAFSPDGSRLLVATNEFTLLPEAVGPEADPLLLFDTETLEPAAVQLGGAPEGATATDVGYTGDGQGIVATFVDFDHPGSTLVAWDVAAPGSPAVQIEMPLESLEVAPGPDRRVAHLTQIGAAGFQVAAYDLRSGTELQSRALQGEALALDVSPDGSLVAVGEGDDVALLEATTLVEQGRFSRHSLPISSLDFSPDGTTLASGSFDRTAVVWDVGTGAVVDELVGHAGEMWSARFDAGGSRVLTAGLDQHLYTWDLTGRDRYVSRRWEISAPDMQTYALAPDGGAAAMLANGFLQQVDVADGSTSDAVDAGRGAILDLAWHPDRSPGLATAGEDGVVRVWDGSTDLLDQRQLASGPLAAIDYTADGDQLLVAERVGALRVLDAMSLARVGDRIELPERVLMAEILPGGGAAVAMTWDEAVLVVDLASGEVERRVEIGFFPTAADLSPDGSRLALGGAGGEISLLDPASGDWVRDGGLAHGDTVASVAFSPNGEVLVSGGADGRVARFDGRTGTQLDAVQPGSSELTFSPGPHADGTIALFADDGSFAVWDPAPEHMVEVACRIAGRELTDPEWRDAFGDRPRRSTCED